MDIFTEKLANQRLLVSRGMVKIPDDRFSRLIPVFVCRTASRSHEGKTSLPTERNILQTKYPSESLAKIDNIRGSTKLGIDKPISVKTTKQSSGGRKKIPVINTSTLGLFKSKLPSNVRVAKISMVPQNSNFRFGKDHGAPDKEELHNNNDGETIAAADGTLDCSTEQQTAVMTIEDPELFFKNREPPAPL